MLTSMSQSIHTVKCFFDLLLAFSSGLAFWTGNFPQGLYKGTSPSSGLVAFIVFTYKVFIFPYLDDWLLSAISFLIAQEVVQLVLKIHQDLGFVINYPKSHLHPTQDNRFIGVQFYPVIAQIFFPLKEFRPYTAVSHLFQKSSLSQHGHGYGCRVCWLLPQQLSHEQDFISNHC